MKKFYLTTPIYYTNGTPHIGHAYSTIVADLLRRLKRMQGYDAVLTTGTDEHGVNVERSARKAGLSPQEFCDRVAVEWRRTWDALGLRYDRFIRTSDPKHHETVRWLFERCLANGYIYEGKYTGQYCIFDNLYVNEAGPGDPCPECGRPTETVSEENYFFKLSAFKERLLKLYEDQPGFINPESRRNEVLAFVRGELRDLSITRTTIEWGIPAPVGGKHVIYVWFDALIAYLSAVKDDGYWPADLHLIGKEILRFHAVFWPAFLMAADLPLPKRLFAHGWLLFEQDKMSKSRGNIVRPEPIQQVMGADAMRYFLLREIVFGQDGGFSYDALVGRYNADLANGLGNLASRTLTMIRQYTGGAIPAAEGDAEIAAQAREAIASSQASFERLEFSRGLETIWALLGAVDRFIVQRAPWKLAQQPDSRPLLESTLYTAAETLRVTAALLAPAMPESAAKIWSQLGMAGSIEDVRLDELDWGGLAGGQKIREIAAVFPRLDVKETIAKIGPLEAELAARHAALTGKAGPDVAPTAAPATEKITIDDFARIDLRTGVVRSAERVKGANKLLHLKVDIGEAEPRSIVAGIAEAYAPEQILGRTVVIVANLQPRKLRGLVSEGMIVAASGATSSPALPVNAACLAASSASSGPI
ncbi:MAG: methionine--tRNA ligase, partial [Bryobacteraceae bacterium]